MKRLIVNLLFTIVAAISTISCGKESTDTVKYDDQAFFDKYDFAGYPIAELKNLEVIGEDFSLFTLSDGVHTHSSKVKKMDSVGLEYSEAFTLFNTGKTISLTILYN